MTPSRERGNLPTSVRARLHHLARARGEEFQYILSAFAIERLLYRIGISHHSGRFILKGATLFRLWSPGDHRATWDLDLLGRGASAVADVIADVRALCALEVHDAITFDPTSIRGEEIRVAGVYAGVRVHLEAWLAGARIPVQVDVGFGDAVVPAPQRANFPTLLNHPTPNLLVYPREVVFAEKLEAICSLGVTTSRMKDFYDLHFLASSFDFRGEALVRAVRTTFKRRGTPVPVKGPLALTRRFLAAPERQVQWRAFLRRSRLPGPIDAATLVDTLREFLVPVLRAGAQEDALAMDWPAGGPWQPRSHAPGAGSTGF